MLHSSTLLRRLICWQLQHHYKMYLMQVVEELFTYWSLEDADDTLEELEEALIVSIGLLAASLCIAT